MAAFAMALAISAAGGVALGLVLGVRRFAGEVAEPILSSVQRHSKSDVVSGNALDLRPRHVGQRPAFGVIHGMIPVVLFTIAASLKRPASTATHGPSAATELSADGAQRASTGRDAKIITGLRVGFAL